MGTCWALVGIPVAGAEDRIVQLGEQYLVGPLQAKAKAVTLAKS